MKLTKILNEDENPCWKGYKQVGMKTKNGKEVPNCVPESVSRELDELYNLIDESDINETMLQRVGDLAQKILPRDAFQIKMSSFRDAGSAKERAKSMLKDLKNMFNKFYKDYNINVRVQEQTITTQTMKLKKILTESLDKNTVNEITALSGLQDISKGNSSRIEGHKISKDMADEILRWMTGSPYAKRYKDVIKKAGIDTILKLVVGPFGIGKKLPSNLKGEFKVLKDKYKKNESVNEAKNDDKYVVIAFHEKGGGFVMTKPGSKKDAEDSARSITKTSDITQQKAVKVSDARKIRYLVGKEYLNEESVNENNWNNLMKIMQNKYDRQGYSLKELYDECINFLGKQNGKLAFYEFMKKNKSNKKVQDEFEKTSFYESVNEAKVQKRDIDWIADFSPADFEDWYDDGMELDDGKRIASLNRSDELKLFTIVDDWIEAEDDLMFGNGSRQDVKNSIRDIIKFLVQKGKVISESVNTNKLSLKSLLNK